MNTIEEKLLPKYKSKQRPMYGARVCVEKEKFGQFREAKAKSRVFVMYAIIFV